MWDRCGNELDYPFVFLIPDDLEEQQIPYPIRQAMKRGEAKVIPSWNPGPQAEGPEA